MIKKKSLIIDLRKSQIESRADHIVPKTENAVEYQELDTFELQLYPKSQEIHQSNQSPNNSINEWDIHIPEDTGTLDNTIIELTNPILQIEFIPKSAKKYSKRHTRFHVYSKLFLFNKDMLYASRASFSIFLSLCLITIMSIPSLRMVNNTLRVKDNLLLQASASEGLLKNTNTDNIQNLSTALNEISLGLNQSSNDISAIQGNLSGLLPIIPGLSVIQDGSELTQDISVVIALSGELSTAIHPFITKEINPFDTTKSITLVDGIQNIQNINTKLVPALDKLSSSLDALPIGIIPGYRGDILRQLNQDIPKLKNSIIESEQYVNIFLHFVGGERLKRYVFIFQNNQELRATGGFIGSFGLMNIDKGVVEKLDIKEIYNPDGQLLKQILAPNPLQELSSRWYLRDSNWFADFPTSAQKIISFYEKTGGATPDGVISLTPTVIERLLTITGPITLDNYGVTVNADNFVKTTQYQTGVAYDKVINKPKQFIADLAPILINTLLSSDATQYQKIIEALNNSFQEKQILLYFLDPTLQDTVNKYNLGGQLYDAPKDYLSVVHSNIGGYKTDGVMQDVLKVETNIQDNGNIVNKVRVGRSHKGGDTGSEWWDKDNINYMRIYIPKGSRLLNVEGYTDREEKPPLEGTASFEQDVDIKAINNTLVHNEEWDIDTFEESGKFVIGGWIITKPGDTSNIAVEYELPFQVKSGDIYSFILQKQSGTLGVKYEYNLNMNSQFRSTWKESSFDLKDTDTGYQVIDGILRTDEYIGLQLK